MKFCVDGAKLTLQFPTLTFIINLSPFVFLNYFSNVHSEGLFKALISSFLFFAVYHTFFFAFLLHYCVLTHSGIVFCYSDLALSKGKGASGGKAADLKVKVD